MTTASSSSFTTSLPPAPGERAGATGSQVSGNAPPPSACGRPLPAGGTDVETCSAESSESRTAPTPLSRPPADAGFAVGGDRSFAGDLARVREWLAAGRPFAFSRFGDGEWMIVRNLDLDYTRKGNGEFRFCAADPRDQTARRALIASFHYAAPGYLVGIGCPCCWGRDRLLALRRVCRQPEHRLTWANLWGNANYPVVRREIIPLFRRYRDVFLVCHRRADPSRLPFRVTTTFPVGVNAWTEDFSLGDRIADLAQRHSPGAVFLFCAGPLSNILTWRGFAANPTHTYLDLGSILDPWLFARRRLRWLDWFPGLIRSPGVTRGYLKPGRKRRQVCQWWTPTADELAAAPPELPADVLPLDAEPPPSAPPVASGPS